MNARLALTAGLALLLVGCRGVAPVNPALDSARQTLASVRANPAVVKGASTELRQAQSEYARAERAWEERRDEAETRHLAYLARQRATIAANVGAQYEAEQRLSQAGLEREQLRAQIQRSRTTVAAAPAVAAPSAALAAPALAAPVIQTPAPTPQPERAVPAPLAAPRETAALPARANGGGTTLAIGAAPRGAQYIAPGDAAPGSARAAAAESTARGAQFISPTLQAVPPGTEPGPSAAAAPAERSRQLAQQLAQVDGRSGARSGVVTLPDVLFDSNGSRLRSGAGRAIEQLVEVMRRFPERRILLEGFTDNMGAQTFNYDLSQRRAESVRAALLAAGADSRRIDISAQGPAGPVASNATSSGRAQNRRVEVIFSDESGRFPSR